MQEGNTHMKTKTHAVLLALAAWLCAGGAGAVETVPAGAPDHGGGAPLVAVKAAEVRDGRLCVAFDAGGRCVARAELLATEDANPVLERRAWSATPVPGFDGTRTSLAVPVPARAVMFFVNLVTDDGLVVSTRIFTRE